MNTRPTPVRFQRLDPRMAEKEATVEAACWLVAPREAEAIVVNKREKQDKLMGDLPVQVC